MKKHEEEAKLLHHLLQYQESTRSVYLSRINNYAVRAVFLNETLYLEHNIGGMKRPSKKEACVLLEGLVNYYQELCKNNVDLTTFLEDKQFVAELVVVSGHMDIKVASSQNDTIVWHTKLE